MKPLRLISFLGIALALSGCTLPQSGAEAWELPPLQSVTVTPGGPVPTAIPLPENSPFQQELVPTPDAPHAVPNLRKDTEYYYVQPGDTLNAIAQSYNMTVEQILEVNTLLNPNLLEVGQEIMIPVPEPLATGPAFKIIPDSELVYGPAAADFQIEAYILQAGGYLSGYLEEVNGELWTGAQIVTRIAQNYSVNPLLLLAVLEHRSGWVTQASPAESSLENPIGRLDSTRTGLYRQLAFAADNLNRGFYMWRVNGVATWALTDSSIIPVNPTINAGTAGVQYFFSQLTGLNAWTAAVSESGLFSTYYRLFGYPFNRAVEPLRPADLIQPAMQLPFEPGDIWAFTGGPHGGWDNGSGWAALDFAPPGPPRGCVSNDAWVVAVADGIILRTGDGQVIQELDGDGSEQTGWVVLYMHIETRDRVEPGTIVRTGDRIGHPSCEGGFSTGTHLHIARRYNGEWIPADQASLPFIMDGWVSMGAGSLYNGYLLRGDSRIEAENGRDETNEISR